MSSNLTDTLPENEVNHTIKLCFVHIPKTGGMSIGEALGLNGVRHNPCSYYRKNYPDYMTFTVIRGYTDRLNSSQSYHEQNKDRIKNWNESLILQHKPLDYYLDEPCDYYLRFEHLQYDFNEMLRDMGYGEIKLEYLNKSK
jgi:hypothetical protein